MINNRLGKFCYALALLISLGNVTTGTSEEKKNGVPQAEKKALAIAPAEKLEDGWEEIDERLVFLMIRLANTESSLDAVEKVILENARKQNVKGGDARRAVRQNEKMDQKGGGPMKWNQFYGTTAEKFFFHPTDRNSTYHTVTILTPQNPRNDNQVRAGVPSRQGQPPHLRPPQFDYIYRANETAKARADQEAALLGNKIDELNERRRKLELEQVALWIEIAFRAAAHFDLDKKPLIRFEPMVVEGDVEAQGAADTLRSAATFMRVSLSIIDEVTKDEAGTLLRIKPAIKHSRQILNDAWLRLGVDTTNKNTAEGKFAALAKRLDDVASNLTESYEVATEGDETNDQQRKETFREQLQNSLVSYAQIVLAMDEMFSEMTTKWSLKPNLDKPYSPLSLSSFTPSRSHGSRQPAPAGQPAAPLAAKIAKTDVSNLEELNTADLEIAPWISSDGLEIFWATGPVDKALQIWTAQRASTTTTFSGQRRLFAGFAPVLSSNGEELIFRRADSEVICTSNRAARGAEFSEPQTVKSLTFPNLDAAPRWLTDDGLTLFLDMKSTEDHGRYHTWVTTRNTIDSAWKKPTLVRTNFPGKPKDFRFIQASGTPDDLRLYCTAEFTPAGGTSTMRAGVLSRSQPGGPFTRWDEIAFPAYNGQQPSCLRPQFVPATGELYVSSDSLSDDPQVQKHRRYDLWVIKGFQAVAQ